MRLRRWWVRLMGLCVSAAAGPVPAQDFLPAWSAAPAAPACPCPAPVPPRPGPLPPAPPVGGCWTQYVPRTTYQPVWMLWNGQWFYLGVRPVQTVVPVLWCE